MKTLTSCCYSTYDGTAVVFRYVSSENGNSDGCVVVFHGCMRPVAAGIAIRTPDGISSYRCFVGLARGVFPVNFICYCCVVITKGFVIYLLEDKEELSLRLLDVRIFLISVVILFLEL